MSDIPYKLIDSNIGFYSNKSCGLRALAFSSFSLPLSRPFLNALMRPTANRGNKGSDVWRRKLCAKFILTTCCLQPYLPSNFKLASIDCWPFLTADIHTNVRSRVRISIQPCTCTPSNISAPNSAKVDRRVHEHPSIGRKRERTCATSDCNIRTPHAYRKS